jgi:hypothetical protein
MRAIPERIAAVLDATLLRFAQPVFSPHIEDGLTAIPPRPGQPAAAGSPVPRYAAQNGACQGGTTAVARAGFHPM